MAETDVIDNASVDEAQSDDVAELGIYELGYHLVPTLSDEELPAAASRVKDALEKQGATFLGEGAPQKMRLAYTMERAEAGKRERFDSAYFGWLKFELSPEATVELQDELRRMREVLRFLLISTTREATSYSRTISKPGAREERSEGPAMTDEELDKTISELAGDEKKEA